jgi:hypothetical protein
MELAAHSGDFGAAFIEHARQDCVSAKAQARAPWRTLR